MGDFFMESRELIERLDWSGAPRVAVAVQRLAIDDTALGSFARFVAGDVGLSVDRGLALCDALYAWPRRQALAPEPAGDAR